MYTHTSRSTEVVTPQQSSAVHGRLCRSRRAGGFSLIEMMVSVTLFIVVMTVSVGTLLALINANQKAQSLKSVINNLNFAMESMTRTIRTGSTYRCEDALSDTGQLPTGFADCPSGKVGFVMTDDTNKRVAYRINGTQIERRIADSSGNGGTWVGLTASEVVIDGMRFYVTGTTLSDPIQPTVTISIRGHVGTKADTQSTFNIQTTVSQRLLDN